MKFRCICCALVLGLSPHTVAAAGWSCTFDNVEDCKSNISLLCQGIAKNETPLKYQVTLEPSSNRLEANVNYGKGWIPLDHEASDFFEGDGFKVLSLGAVEEGKNILIVTKPDRSELSFRGSDSDTLYTMSGTCKEME